MEFVNLIFAGFGGAVLTSVVMVAISRIKFKKSSAYKFLESQQIELTPASGEYFEVKNANRIKKYVQNIYGKVIGDIIATAFHENPVRYGEFDFVGGFQYGKFTRITCEEICNEMDQVKAECNLRKIKPGSDFICIPKGMPYTRLDGIFVRFQSGSYLALVSFRNPEDETRNKSIIFCDGIAEYLFEYYEDLIPIFKRPESSKQLK
jgi:hypothetical protein